MKLMPMVFAARRSTDWLAGHIAQYCCCPLVTRLFPATELIWSCEHFSAGSHSSPLSRLPGVVSGGAAPDKPVPPVASHVCVLASVYNGFDGGHATIVVPVVVLFGPGVGFDGSEYRRLPFPIIFITSEKRPMGMHQCPIWFLFIWL